MVHSKTKSFGWVMAATVALLSACGDTESVDTRTKSAQPESVTDGADRDLTAAAKAPCGTSEVQHSEIEKAANAVLGSPYFQTIDTFQVGSWDYLTDAQADVRFGEIVSVTDAEQQPFNIIPIENKDGSTSATNTAAGNSAFWNGVIFEISTDEGPVTVSQPLAPGGPDVIAVLQAPDASQLRSLEGACALVVASEIEEPASLGGPRLVAAAEGPDSKPVALDPSFTTMVEDSATLEGLVK